LSYLRIQWKSKDPFAASRALQELATSGLEDDVIGSFVDSIAASHIHIGGDH
jgi:hypothetical protein